MQDLKKKKNLHIGISYSDYRKSKRNFLKKKKHGKYHLTYTGTRIGITLDFSWEVMQQKESETKYLPYWREAKQNKEPPKLPA